MKKSVLALFIASGLLVGGCLAGPHPAPDLKVERLSAASASIGEVWVSRSDQGIEVNGILKDIHPIRLPGVIDLELVAADGRILGTSRGEIFLFASRGGGLHQARFVVTLDRTAPADAILRLHYHPLGDPTRDAVSPAK